MNNLVATAISHPNIAFIKYWGNRDDHLRLPSNGSISMNLDGLFTRTRVTFSPDRETDILILNQRRLVGQSLDRVSQFLDRVRLIAKSNFYAVVESSNNFPMGAGVASSAAAFSALALAATTALGLQMDQASLSRLARTGSGSACRSIPAGFVEWLPGNSDQTSVATSIAPPSHWNLVDCIAILQPGQKPVGSTEGHTIASTSPLQPARLKDTSRRLNICRKAILDRDFNSLASIIELDSNLMHAVMVTSTPALFYWEPASLGLIKTIPRWRADGLPVCYTLDAGANVHAICLAEAAADVKHLLEIAPGVRQVLTAGVGGPAHLD